MNTNQQLCKLLGICWHEPYDLSVEMSDEYYFDKDCKCQKCGIDLVSTLCKSGGI
jgi:hypothetical protein